jgi:hypothetical protein
MRPACTSSHTTSSVNGGKARHILNTAVCSLFPCQVYLSVWRLHTPRPPFKDIFHLTLTPQYLLLTHPFCLHFHLASIFRLSSFILHIFSRFTRPTYHILPPTSTDIPPRTYVTIYTLLLCLCLKGHWHKKLCSPWRGQYGGLASNTIISANSNLYSWQL